MIWETYNTSLVLKKNNKEKYKNFNEPLKVLEEKYIYKLNVKNWLFSCKFLNCLKKKYKIYNFLIGRGFVLETLKDEKL